jgi:hypothetical protein
LQRRTDSELTRRDGTRVTYAVLASLLVHVLLLTLLFGGDARWPTFGFPWQDRRMQVPDLRVLMVPSPTRAAEPTTSPLEHRSEPISVTPSRLASNPVSNSAAASKSAAPASDLKSDGGRNVTSAKVANVQPVPAQERVADNASPPTNAPSVIALVRPDEQTWMVPQSTETTTPLASALPTITIPENAPTPPRRQRSTARARVESKASEPDTRTDAAPVINPVPPDATQVDPVPRDVGGQEVPGSEAPGPDAELAKEAATRRAAEREETERKETERKDAERRDAELKAAERRDAERKDAERRDAERRDAERKDAERKDAERREAERRDAERRDTERKDAERREAERKDAERKDAERKDAERRDAERRDAERRDAERRDAERRDAERREAERNDAERKEAERKQAERKEAAERREAALRAIGRQLDEEAARREAASRALPSASSARRYRLWGQSDPNAELVLYALVWARKIESNMTFDMIREAAKQPHRNPVVIVAVRSDGSVERVTFEVSSGVPALDEAVRRVVESQLPYRPFPPALARD